MMYQATIEIRDKYEHETFEQLVSIFQMHRANPQPILGDQPQHKTEPQSQAKPHVQPQETELDPSIVGKIGTPDATITDVQLIDAFTKYAPGKGAPALAALLAKYDATRVIGIAQKRRAEFLKEIGG